MIQFLLDNSIWIIFSLFVGGNIASWVYDNFCYKETPDDWFERMSMYELMKKNHRTHPGFVGSYIRLSRDTHYVTTDKDGNPVRLEREKI